MATDVERLAIALEARTNTFERQLAAATRKMDQEAGRMEARTRALTSNVERQMGSIKAATITRALAPIGAALAGALSIGTVAAFSDAFTRVQNSLRVAGLEGEELRSTYQQLFDVAQRQGAPLEATATLYGRVAAAQKELGVTSQQIVNFTEGVGVALRVAGTDARAASDALLQLGQAIGSGVVRAEEFNSILEGARPVLVAVANGLKEAGGSVATLRTLVTEGKVSSAAFFAAFEAGRPVLDDLARNAVPTISQGLEKLKNEAINAVGAINNLTGFTRTLGGAMDSVAGAVREAANALGALQKGYADAAMARGRFIDQGGEDTIQDAFEGAFGNTGVVRPRRPAEAQVTRQAAPDGIRFFDSDREAERGRARLDRPRPVSLADPRFAVPGKGGAGAGGGGGKTASDYDREVESLNRKTAALQLEIQTFGQSAEAISKAKVEQELLNAVQKDGVVASEAQRQKISELAAAFAETEAKLKSMRDAQEQAAELQKFIGSSVSGFFSDVISGGKNAEEALSRLIKKLAEAALQAALLGDGPLAGIFGTKGGGGLIGALVSGFTGGAGGGVGAPMRLVGAPSLDVGTSNVPRDMVANIHKGEMIIPAYDAALIRKGAAGRPASQPVNLNLSIDARGATPDAVRLLEQRIPGIVMQTVQQGRMRGAL
jgi:tape measure domain-containing protein